jgi:hypothetical protein
MTMPNELKPYLKVITRNSYGVCAIYEPHPFRNGAIKEAVEQSGHTMSGNTGIEDTAWCWVYYDWCGNPVGLSDEFPEGEVVDKFTKENLGDQNLADYLNKENQAFVDAWNRRADNG